MKTEIKDVDSGELSRFVQSLREHLEINTDTMRDATAAALRDIGDHRTVIDDTIEVWVLEGE